MGEERVSQRGPSLFKSALVGRSVEGLSCRLSRALSVAGRRTRQGRDAGAARPIRAESGKTPTGLTDPPPSVGTWNTKRRSGKSAEATRWYEKGRGRGMKTRTCALLIRSSPEERRPAFGRCRRRHPIGRPIVEEDDLDSRVVAHETRNGRLLGGKVRQSWCTGKTADRGRS